MGVDVCHESARCVLLEWHLADVCSSLLIKVVDELCELQTVSC